MPFDGMFLHYIKNELEKDLIGAIVDKINQPQKDELVISFRNRNESVNVLITANASRARICRINRKIENPKVPYMLCMLFRKKLVGARLTNIRQLGLDRVVFLDFLAKNDIGDVENFSLAVEIMGKYSNIVLINDKGIIVDAVKRVDENMSSKREILPGIKYLNVPPQDKLNILNCNNEEIEKQYENLNIPMAKFMSSRLQGMSINVAREYERKFNKDMTKFEDLLDELRNFKGTPYMMLDDCGDLKDYSFVRLSQYDNFKQYDTFSELVDDFYVERDIRELIRTRASDIYKLLTNIHQKLNNKIQALNEDLSKSMDREKYRIYGDILSANIYKLKGKRDYVELENFYENPTTLIKIKLDPRFDAVQNSQRYYKEYKKLSIAENKIKEQIENAKEEKKYVESLLFCLDSIETNEEIDRLRLELINQGYIKSHKNNNISKIKPKSNYLEFETSEGLKVLVGRNNVDNDKLTFKKANKNDIWFHIKDVPGSHVILFTEGKEVSEKSIEEAAQLAAYYSKSDKHTKTAIDYTKVCNVSKYKNAKPGMVIYVKYKTIYVFPKTID